MQICSVVGKQRPGNVSETCVFPLLSNNSPRSSAFRIALSKVCKRGRNFFLCFPSRGISLRPHGYSHTRRQRKGLRGIETTTFFVTSHVGENLQVDSSSCERIAFFTVFFECILVATPDTTESDRTSEDVWHNNNLTCTVYHIGCRKMVGLLLPY